MGIALFYDNGQTPIEDDEKEGLLIKAITTREELDEFEQKNIQQAMLWLLGKQLNKNQILSEAFIMELHKKMFGTVWLWAGTVRKTNKNIGVDKFLIRTELRQLLDDCIFWMDNQTYGPDEIAIRFQHKLVCIHCFPNGNGRHSRLIADVVIEKIYNEEVFSWGANSQPDQESRTLYLNALRSADRNDYQPLVAFARS